MIIQEWLLYNSPKVINTPVQSPDLNQTEIAWDRLDKKIRKNSVTSKTDLRNKLIEKLKKI